jgi:hypothetical protein
MNASKLSFLDALSGQGIFYQSQYLPAGLMLKSSTTLVSVRKLSAKINLLILRQFASYTLSYIIYNLYFHPLRNYPGPFWARASLLWRIYRSMDGRFHRHLENCHKRYGESVLVELKPTNLRT